MYPSEVFVTYHFCPSVPLPALMHTFVPAAALFPSTVRYFSEFVFLRLYQPSLICAVELVFTFALGVSVGTGVGVILPVGVAVGVVVSRDHHVDALALGDHAGHLALAVLGEDQLPGGRA